MEEKIKYISKFFYKGEARYKVRYPKYKIRSFKTMKEAQRYLWLIEDNVKIREQQQRDLKKAEKYGVDDILKLDTDTLTDIRKALKILPKGRSLYKAVCLLIQQNQQSQENKATKEPQKKTTFELALDEFYNEAVKGKSDSSIKILHKRLYSLRNFRSFKVRGISSIYKPLEGLSKPTKQSYITVYKNFFWWAWHKNKNYNAKRIYKYLDSI